MTLPKSIFNETKTDYENTPLFLGQQAGLLDTINIRHPKIWELYLKMKSLDWDHAEFDFTSCNAEFKSCPKNIKDIMIKTIAWQWESDSIAARAIAPIVAPFVSSTELWACWQRISDNEVLHASTYSEIVRNSFDNPDEVLSEVLKVTESLQRAKTISDVFQNTYVVSHKLALGEVEKNQETYNQIFMFVCALYMMERIQFINSFAVTFAIAETNVFVPIANAVRKICQDELEVHSVLDRLILTSELNTKRGQTALRECKPLIQKMFDEVIETEFRWAEYILPEGQEMIGFNAELLNKSNLFNASQVKEVLQLECRHEIPKTNPLKFMDTWVNVNAIQGSPQENRDVSYMLGGVEKDDGEVQFEVDF